VAPGQRHAQPDAHVTAILIAPAAFHASLDHIPHDQLAHTNHDIIKLITMEKSAQVNTEHTDMVHDAQPDYYGKRVATCSSDRSIKIFEGTNENYTQVAELKGHEGPVWQVCWGHPKFGVILASCGYDRKVIVWKEAAKNVWEKIYVYEGHELSVNSLAFAPHDFGLILACASSDGHVSVLTYAEGKWDAQRFPAHQIGVNSISWAPAVAPGALLRSASAAGQPPVRRFVTGGCDNLVKIWRYSPQDNQWRCEDKLKAHQDWVRDVAWSPNMGSTASVLASCSQDKTVVIWTQEDSSKGWEPRPLGTFNEVRPLPRCSPLHTLLLPGMSML
jgi:protein transport protein SEC13